MMRATLLAVACVAQSTPFAFTSAYTEYGATQVYELRAGEICEGFDISVTKHPQEYVKNSQCYKKCVIDGSKDDACKYGLLADESDDSDALCLAEAECKDLCWNLDECVGIEMHKEKPRCFLQLWECAGAIAEGTLTASATFDMHIKQVPWQSSCPLGLSVEIDGGAYGVDGTYLEAEDGIYESVDGDARIYWDNCQWVVQKPFTPPKKKKPTVCVDHVAEANYLFGLLNGTYNDHICEIAQVAGYCSSLVFAGVCPKTCELDVPTCTGNNEDAATALATIWGLTVTGCSLKCDIPTQSDGMGDSDPVVKALCKKPCPEEKKLSGATRRMTGKPRTAFASLELHGLDLVAEANRVRKLAEMTAWKSFFWTQYPPVGLKEACSPKSRNVNLLNDLDLCDAYRFERPQIGIQVYGVCPDQKSYSTTTGSYCALLHSPKDLVKEHLCVTKCADGQTGTYCDGYDPLFLPESEALCLPRSECERVCDELKEDCSSIDMHRSKNRCYLNLPSNCTDITLPRATAAEGGTDADVKLDSEYLLLRKTESEFAFTTVADSYCPGTNVYPPDLPQTELAGAWLYDHQCIAAHNKGKCNPFGPKCKLGENCFCEGVVGLRPEVEEDTYALCLDRELCEQACAETEACESFDMHQTLPRCYLNVAGACDTKKGKDIIKAYEADALFEVVTKVMPLPCYPSIARNETAADDVYAVFMDDGYEGDYKANNEAATAADATGLTRGFLPLESWTEDGITVGWTGCAWEVVKDGMVKFSTDSMQERCQDEEGYEYTAPNLKELEKMDLYFDFCPNRKDMTMRRMCSGMSLCPVLTRCVVTTARMNVELEGMRKGGRADTGLLSDSEMCKDIVGNRTLFVAKQIASPVRTEYNVDIATYGPHFLEHAVYRDEPDAPAVTFEHFGGAAQVTVTLASSSDTFPDNAEHQLGRLYDVPAGYSAWVSDVVRVETFGVGCDLSKITDTSINFTVHAEAETGIGLFKFDSRTGMPLGMAKVTIPLDAEDKLLEDTFDVESAVTDGATDFVAAADINECAEDDACSENANCINTIGSFNCVCKPGFSEKADGSCEPETYTCPTISIKVSNGDALDFGWRLREIKLYSDENCETEVAPGPASQYEPTSLKTCAATEIGAYDHQREIVRALQCNTKCGPGTYKGARRLSRARRMQLSDDWSNCAGYDKALDAESTSNALCAGYETCVDVCNQLHDCAGFYMPEDKNGKQEDRCILYSGCDSMVPAPDDFGTFWTKAYKVEVFASEGDPLHPPMLVIDSFGTNADVADAPPFDNTEWWSHCYDCPKNSAYVMVNVRIPAGQPCKVHGMKLFQDPDYASSKVNVVAGTGAGGSGVWTYKAGETFPAQGCTDGGFFDKNGAGCSAYVNGGWCNGKAGEYGSGWKQGEDSTIPANANADGIDAWEGCCACGGGERTGLNPEVGIRGAPESTTSALHGKFYSEWLYDDTPTCKPLTCGQTEVLYSGDVIDSIHDVESPCMCKQLCLEAAGQGCVVWGLYAELDDHHLAVADSDEPHLHRICYLMGGDWGISDAEVSTWTSGTIDTVLTGFTPEKPTGTFDLKVKGVHLSESTGQRIKLVQQTTRAASMGDRGCSGPPAEEVSGVGCSDSAICSPQPASSNATEAVWSGISIAAAEEETEYVVCYCSGPCYADWQYTPVPGSIKVEGSGFKWELSKHESTVGELAALDRAGVAVRLTVKRPPFHFSLSNNTGWYIKVVSANDACSDNLAGGFTIGNREIPEGSFPDNFNDATFDVNFTGAQTAGRFLVCFQEEDDGDYVPISSEKTRYLDIALAEADLTAPEGVYRNQHWSAVARTSIKMEVKGSFGTPAAWDLSEITFEVGSCTGAASDHNESAHAQVLAQANSTSADTITYETVLVGNVPGRYAVCISMRALIPPAHDSVKNLEIGTLTVTERADVGWTYVLDPEGASSVEITGTGLKWKNDRIMIVDCQATCGVSSPADGVTLEGKSATLHTSNTFVAQNDLFDAEDDERMMVDLPSELRTYTTVISHYCKGNNLGEEELGEDVWNHQCHSKCSKDPTIEGCGGYSEDVDHEDNTALCMSEAQCREACSLNQDCYGIDMWAGGNRCFLNRKGTAEDGCKTQYENADLGPSTSWTFLAKEGSSVMRKLKTGDGLSTTEVLRFKPIEFETGGSYKVCFCDSSLLPAGQQHCHAESDYDVEVGSLIVSGVSCLLQETDFRRRTCYGMFHGGLACSEDIEYPTIEVKETTATLPSTQATP
jgi:hypothetical protein